MGWLGSGSQLANRTQRSSSQQQRSSRPGIEIEPGVIHSIKRKPQPKASRAIVKARVDRRKAELAERKRQAELLKLNRQTELRTAKAEKAEALARQRKANLKARKLHPISLLLGRPKATHRGSLKRGFRSLQDIK